MKPAMPILALAILAGNARAAPVRDGPVQAELISEVTAVAPGKPFTVAFRMTLDESWHAYWTNPGDSGLAPSLNWTLPDGFTAGDLQHPPPTAIPTPPFMTYGHEGEVLFLVTLTPPAVLEADFVTLRAEADWLVCRDFCLPGSARLDLTLPVGPDPAPPNPLHADVIRQARENLPRASADFRIHAETSANRYRLLAQPTGDSPEPVSSAVFFPDSPDVILHAAPQVFQSAGNGFTLEMEPAGRGDALPERLSGVLVLQGPAGRQAWRVSAPFSKTASPGIPQTERNAP
jgi:thiol:disulfide interchange protein DsbD